MSIAKRFVSLSNNLEIQLEVAQELLVDVSTKTADAIRSGYGCVDKHGYNIECIVEAIEALQSAIGALDV